MNDKKEVVIDEDIDIERLFSGSLKILCCRYDSLFVGSHDNVDDIYFFDKQNRYFFTFTDAFTSIYASTEFMSDKEREGCKGDFAFMSPILRAVYVCKDYRGMGLQKEIVESINEVAEEAAEPYLAVADIFKLSGSRWERNAKIAWHSFMMDGYERDVGWREKTLKQCRSFEGYGLERFVLPEYSLTESWQHYIYLPESCSNGVKLTVKTIQRKNKIIGY